MLSLNVPPKKLQLPGDSGLRFINAVLLPNQGIQRSVRHAEAMKDEKEA